VKAIYTKKDYDKTNTEMSTA